MLTAPTPDELGVWLTVAGPATATGAVLWTPGEQALSFGWAAVGGPPLFVRLPAGLEVGFSFDGPQRWALDGPDGPLGRSDGRRAVAWRDDEVEHGAWLVTVPQLEELLLPRAAEDGGGEVSADERLGRACWRWTTEDQVRWVDDQTGSLLARQSSQGTLALTRFEPGAAVDPSLFDVDAVHGPAVEEVPQDGRPRPPDPTFEVPWWPHGTLSFPVAGDAGEQSLLVQLVTGDDRDPSVWVGVAPRHRRAPVQQGARSRRWDGEDCSLSLSWRGDLSDEQAERIAASIPPRWP